MPCVHVYNMFQSAVKYFDMGFESVSCWLFLVWGVFIQRYIFLTLNLSLDMPVDMQLDIQLFFVGTYSMA